MQIRWSPRAASELDAIFLHIAKDNESAAMRQIRLILAATRQLEHFPELGRRLTARNARELVVLGTPYILRYSLKRGAVELISITHGAMRATRR